MSAASAAHSSGSFVADAWNPIGVVVAAVVAQGGVALVAVAAAWRSIVVDRGIGRVRRGQDVAVVVVVGRS